MTSATAAPQLSPVPQPDPPSADEPSFDAKAMVAAMTRKVEHPAYGALPAAGPEGREAAERLRELARQKRRRDRRVAWLVAAVFFGGIGTAGLLAFREYQRDQDRQAAERAAKPDDAEPGAAARVDDELASTAPAGTGGLLGSVDAAQGAVDALDERNDDAPSVAAGPSAAPSAPGAAVLPGARSIGFDFRRYDGAAPGSAFIHYEYLYDREDDNAIVVVDRSDAPSEVIGFSGPWRVTWHADGVLDRVVRSGTSLAPGPDAPWADLFGEDAVLPNEARPFATEQPVDRDLGLDDASRVRSFVIDADAFRRAAPDVYRAWLGFWTAPAADSEVLVDPSVRQVRLDGADVDAPADRPSIDLPDLDGPIEVDGVLVVYGTNPSGFVDAALVVDPVNDFRVFWALAGLSDDGALVEFGDGWVDAPAG